MGGYAKKPKVPMAPRVSGQQSQIQAAKGNLDALPYLQDLADQTNQFNVGKYQQRMGQLIPDYSRIMGGASGTLADWLNGVISPDVASQVRRNSNVRAFGGGYAGSGMGDNLQARDLGLTSMNLQQQGLSALPGFVGASQLGAPAQWNPAQDYMSTEGQIGLNQRNENNRYNQEWLTNQIKALPDPATAARAHSFSPTETIGELYGGGGAGTGAISGYGSAARGGSGDMANDFMDASNVGEGQLSGGGAASGGGGGY